MEVIVSLLTGVEMAVVHLCHVLDAKGLVSQMEMVKSFEETAERLPAEVMNREIVAIPLRQIATMLRRARSGDGDIDVSSLLR